MNLNYRMVILGGFIVLLVPLVIHSLFLDNQTSSIVSFLLIIFEFCGILLICYGSIRYYQLQSKSIVIEDERTVKIGYIIGTYTLSITILFLFVITLFAQQQIINLSFVQIYWIILLQIAVTIVLLNGYFHIKPRIKKGENQ